LCNHFEVLRFIRKTTGNWGHVAGFGVHGRQVNIVRVIFQTGCPGFRFVTLTTGQQVLVIGTVRVGVRAADGEVAATEVIRYRSTETVAVLFFGITVFVFTLVLQGYIQAINRAEEVGVTVGCQPLERLVMKLSV
jgi:hypothetical protein